MAALLGDMDKIGIKDDSVITGGVKELLNESTPTSVLDIKQALPEPVKNALTKDYRKFMKVVDAKKRGGISNPMIAGISP